MVDSNCPQCLSTGSAGSANNIPKRLVICADGTGCAVDKGKDTLASNVARLSRVISKVGLTKEGKKVSQVVYYQSGVATNFKGTLERAYDTALGGSLNEKVCEAYNFLANNWGPGDEVFLFGFSRGAYTVRSLAGFICQVGLLAPFMMDYFDEIYEVYKSRGKGQTFSQTKWANERLGEGGLGSMGAVQMTRWEYLKQVVHLHVKVKVVGVWDTVGGLGMSGWVDQPGQDTRFHSTTLHPKIENAFHALALDENRGNFAPTMFSLDKACRDANVTLRQCFFPGFHADIGGHDNPAADTNSIDEIAFAWMIDQLDGLLQVSGTSLQPVFLFRIGRGDKITNGSPRPRNAVEALKRGIGWSDGTLHETNGWVSIAWMTSLAFVKRASYHRTLGSWKAQDTNELIGYRALNETIHPSVFHRMSQEECDYKPKNLQLSEKEWKRVSDENGKGFVWIKKLTGGNEIRLPEYKIPQNGPQIDTEGFDHWQGSLERTLAPNKYIQELDKVNW